MTEKEIQELDKAVRGLYARIEAQEETMQELRCLLLDKECALRKKNEKIKVLREDVKALKKLLNIS